VGILKWKNEEIFQISMEEAIQLAKNEEMKLGRALTSEELYSIYALATTNYRLNAKRPLLKPAGIYVFTLVFSIVAMTIIVASMRSLVNGTPYYNLFFTDEPDTPGAKKWIKDYKEKAKLLTNDDLKNLSKYYQIMKRDSGGRLSNEGYWCEGLLKEEECTRREVPPDYTISGRGKVDLVLLEKNTNLLESYLKQTK
jgi:hypothetical protein